ncbi:endonuclease domain-containing protein [Xanthobacter tagetidis]|uniref:Endonuclease domain-containing protein n=1 Tax=Xanthobacter tagetidis TaxID=60216 RepID=A0A3L7A9X0_9HYPH|nr:DUF559 domain-containing protein [Xanthobacter tagetidis]MBB6309544.1 very-short-patch-repair endonuclease [Xanthobacter tagetidis]RLP77103.1 endonuclease domain-containing protein [Xanthobacter tagetidis]
MMSAAPQAPVARARTLRRSMTDAEARLWRLLRDRRFDGAKFRRQVPAGPYVADFLSFGHRLVVEADGGQHAGALRDAARDAFFRRSGFRVLRFWNNDNACCHTSGCTGRRAGRQPLSPCGRGWIAAQPRDG